jgi:beta-carotene 3-hydroxylase
MTPVVVAVLAFLVMEPVSYLAHRSVMHGQRRAAAWHVPHHQVRDAASRADTNDLYPVVMAALTIAAMAVGAWVWSPLLWVGAGVTLYGAAYLFVHDLYIHRRWARFRWTWGPLERVREAHRIHHLFGGEPYGFLFPIVPASLRARARSVTRDPLLPIGR